MKPKKVAEIYFDIDSMQWIVTASNGYRCVSSYSPIQALQGMIDGGFIKYSNHIPQIPTPFVGNIEKELT